MTTKNLLEAMNDINADYISEAYKVKQKEQKKRRTKLRAAVIAASAALVLVGGWTLVADPYMLVDGAPHGLNIGIMYGTNRLTDEEQTALGGVKDTKTSTGKYTRFSYESAVPNELFKAINIDPLRSTNADYDSPTYMYTTFTDFGINGCEYNLTDSATGKRCKVYVDWFTTNFALSTAGGVMMSPDTKTYTLPCGAEAVIMLLEKESAPSGADPDTQVSDPDNEQPVFDEEHIKESLPTATTIIHFTYDNMVYMIRTEHDTEEEVKAFLDTLKTVES